MECPNSARNSARMNPSQCPNTFPFLKEKKYPFCSRKSFGHYEGDIRALVRALFRALFRHYLRVSRPYKVGRPGSRWRCFQGTGTPHGIIVAVGHKFGQHFAHYSCTAALPSPSQHAPSLKDSARGFGVAALGTSSPLTFVHGLKLGCADIPFCL